MKLLVAALLIFFTAGGGMLTVPLAVPGHWPKPQYDLSENPLTADGIYLGRKLFYDPILSVDSSISCASCHSPYNAFAHTDHQLSHGLNDRMGRRNAPALFNLAWHKSFMLDGSIFHLDMVPLAPISHPDEMGNDITRVVDRLKRDTGYINLFQNAYGSSSITGEKTLKAMSQFLITLISANAKYDHVMDGKDTFTVKEERGYIIFKQQCAGCHAEPLFTNGNFYNTGLQQDPVLQDKGRMEVTGDVTDSLAFKVPTLRNLIFTYPYMHDGRFKTLYQVLNHYSDRGNKLKRIQDGKHLPGFLDEKQKTDLIAFLHTLSDRNFPFDSRFTDPAVHVMSSN
jgi:cytochrome c peroxidase